MMSLLIHSRSSSLRRMACLCAQQRQKIAVAISGSSLVTSLQPNIPQLPTSTTSSSRQSYSSTPPHLDSKNNTNNDPTTPSSSTTPPDERTYKLLYRRSPTRSKYPRGMLGFSTLNLTYWTWYVADFTPAINSSANAKMALGQIDQETLELLLIDPTMGFVGLGVSFLIWGAAVSYTRNLVTAIWKLQDSNYNLKQGEEEKDTTSLAVSTMKLPLATTPKILQKARYDPNINQFRNPQDVQFTESELRSDSNIQFFQPGELAVVNNSDIDDILVKKDGKFSEKRGHLALQKIETGKSAQLSDEPLLSHLRKQNYLLDVDEFEVLEGADPDLLRTLVLREDLLRVGKGSGRVVGKRRVPNDTNKREASEGEEEDGVGEVEEKSPKINVGESIARKKRLAMKKKGIARRKR